MKAWKSYFIDTQIFMEFWSWMGANDWFLDYYFSIPK